MESNVLSRRVVDYKGRPLTRPTSTGSWVSAIFLIVVELAERSTYYGVALNLITYLTTRIGQSTAAAAVGVNAWFGISMMMPLLGAFVADSCTGRYWIIAVASLLYVLGLGLLTLSSNLDNLKSSFQLSLVYLSLYLVAFATGGHKPIAAFGADQFDENDPEECVSRSSFFNWWCFGSNLGMVFSLCILSYVQDNISWEIGFGIPCMMMVVATIVFLMGTRTYRYYLLEEESSFKRVGRGFFELVRSRGDGYLLLDGEEKESVHTSQQLKQVNNNDHIEEAKSILRLFPVWSSCLVFGLIFAQPKTFFTKQGATLDRQIGLNFKVPPASLQSIICFSVVAFIPIYDRILVPIARKISGCQSGFTPLQRIGIGIFILPLVMVVAALVEIKRLNVANAFGLVDQPNAILPMSIWWLVPQYVLYGVSEVFVAVGMQEFFYDQVPDSLRSLGAALPLSVNGVGNIISGFLVSVIDAATTKGGESWFSNNLNRAHLDYYYWFLAGLTGLGLLMYLFLAQSYVYKKKVSGAL